MRFSESGFTKLFLFDEKLKKSGAGPAVVCSSFVGAAERESNVSTVRPAAFSLPAMIQSSDRRTGSFGFENGCWNDKPSRS